MKDSRSTKKKRALTRQRNALIRQVDDKTYDKKNKKALTRPKIKIKTNSNRPVEVISVSRFKTTARFADTNTFDLLYFQDKINQDQHQSAEYLYGLALSSNVKLSISSFLSNPIREQNPGGNNQSERSAQSRNLMNKILAAVKHQCGDLAGELLQGVVIYNYSIREWCAINHKGRDGKLQLLQGALNEVKNYRENKRGNP